MFKPFRSTKPLAETKFNRLVVSDEKIMDLCNGISKEATNRWKKALRERTRIREIRNKEKEILKKYFFLAKAKLGIDHLTKGDNPLVAMRSLIEVVIYTRENNQEEI
jgi:hypothetical protein